MAKVVDLERRKVDKLADQIERQLAGLPPMSHLLVPITEVEDPQRWRRAARLAAHRLGWRVATGVSRHGFVWLTDMIPEDTNRRVWRGPSRTGGARIPRSVRRRRFDAAHESVAQAPNTRHSGRPLAIGERS